MTDTLPKTRLELARWRREALVLPVWWRDDDAVKATAELDRLILLAGRFAAPIHLAVIPQPATAELSQRLRGCDGVFVLTHGWSHANHAPEGRKKAEFGADRSLSVMLEETTSGRQRLASMFGESALPIFTPPWNRVAPAVIEHLGSAGFAALSTFTPRIAKFAAEGVLQVNTHLDPIGWKSGGGLLDPEVLDTRIAHDLEARRKGRADNSEPYGLLTHHLVHGDAIWSFIEGFLDVLAGSDASHWTSPLHENG